MNISIIIPHVERQPPTEAWVSAYASVIERLRTEFLVPIGPLELKETVCTVTPSIAENFPTTLNFTHFIMKVRREE